MSSRDMNEPADPIAESIAQPLRAPEVLAPDFEARLLAQARAEVARARATPARKSWWLQRRVITASPLLGMAAAAAIAVVASTSTFAFTSSRRQIAEVATVHDTVQLVRFVFADTNAHSVSLVGDFNAWAQDRTRLQATGRRGVWSVAVPLAPGRHEYAFIVDGKRWVADPLSEVASDEFGTESSVLLVDSRRANDAS